MAIDLGKGSDSQGGAAGQASCAFRALVDSGHLDAHEFAQACSSASLRSASLSSVLAEEYGIAEDALGRCLEAHYGVPFMAYSPAQKLPMPLLANLSKAYLLRHLWLPVGGDKNEAVILMDDPSDSRRVEEIKGVMNARQYQFRVGLPEHIQLYLQGEGAPKQTSGFEDLFGLLAEHERSKPFTKIEVEDEALDISGMILLVNRIISEADRLGASDIHIEPGREGVAGTVRIRVDGQCRQLLEIPAALCEAAIARVKVMSRLNIAERRLPQDGKTKLTLGKRSVEMRVATLPTVQGESVVMRLLTSGTPMSLEALHLSAANLAQILAIAAQPHGLFLVVGPTGSGKTTTLHALLAKLNVPERKIWTVEDPVEITQDGLQQVQVQLKIDFTFAKAMRAFLRADPDIILVGEMRDKETASIGIEASLTGHLVLSTLHTNSAPETLTRLLDLGLDPVHFSDALLGVLAQRLMRTLCERCKEPYTPSAQERRQLLVAYGAGDFQRHGLRDDDWSRHRASGCSECGGTGYKGRMAIHEMLVCGVQQKALIYRRASLDAIRREAGREGMRTMRQDGVVKILSGYSDYAQLIRAVGVATD